MSCDFPSTIFTHFPVAAFPPHTTRDALAPLALADRRMSHMSRMSFDTGPCDSKRSWRAESRKICLDENVMDSMDSPRPPRFMSGICVEPRAIAAKLTGCSTPEENRKESMQHASVRHDMKITTQVQTTSSAAAIFLWYLIVFIGVFNKPSHAGRLADGHCPGHRGGRSADGPGGLRCHEERPDENERIRMKRIADGGRDETEGQGFAGAKLSQVAFVRPSCKASRAEEVGDLKDVAACRAACVQTLACQHFSFTEKQVVSMTKVEKQQLAEQAAKQAAQQAAQQAAEAAEAAKETKEAEETEAAEATPKKGSETQNDEAKAQAQKVQDELRAEQQKLFGKQLEEQLESIDPSTKTVSGSVTCPASQSRPTLGNVEVQDLFKEVDRGSAAPSDVFLQSGPRPTNAWWSNTFINKNLGSPSNFLTQMPYIIGSDKKGAWWPSVPDACSNAEC
eukprot:s892_g21.t1